MIWPRHWDGAMSLGGAMSVNVGPHHWGWSLITGGGASSLETPAEGKRGAATLRCVSGTISALPHLCIILAPTCPFSWDRTSQRAGLWGWCSNSTLSHTCKRVHTCVYRPVLLQPSNPKPGGMQTLSLTLMKDQRTGDKRFDNENIN